MEPFERYVLRRFVGNVVIAATDSLRKRPAGELVEWLWRHWGDLGLGRPVLVADDEGGSGGPAALDDETWRRLKPSLSVLRRSQREPAALSRLERRLRWLTRLLELDRRDSEILGMVVRVRLSRPFRALWRAGLDDCMPFNDEIALDTIAEFLGRPATDLARRFTAAAPLRILGLIEDRHGGDYAPSATVLRLADMETADEERLRRALLGRRRKGDLAWTDFDHLGEPRDMAVRLLEGAFVQKEKGVNILLHGVPGTGKTEFVRTLADRLNAHAVFVGETDEQDSEPTRADRIAAFAVARALAGRAGRTILVVDEADDVFLGVDDDESQGRRGSKVFMNRLVESTEAPTIWITNHPNAMGAAVLRRMMLAIPFQQPGRVVRERIAKRALSRQRLKRAQTDIALVGSIEAPPAVINLAARAARLMGGSSAELVRAANSILEVVKGQPMAVPQIGRDVLFDPALSAADSDLVALADRIAGAGRLDLSLCLSGPPGTGKSAYARYLARRLGIEVLEKRASDLFGPYVGQTEARIASAFREASDQRAMLIFDEADSLLQDRRNATRSWEISQVNEMLTWMERHPMPFVCTTNLMEQLDPATLRRFVFKVAFKPLSLAQSEALFRTTFPDLPVPPGLGRLLTLTPGDFAVVARKAAVLGERDPKLLLGMLAAEVIAKPDGNAQPIGFRVE